MKSINTFNIRFVMSLLFLLSMNANASQNTMSPNSSILKNYCSDEGNSAASSQLLRSNDFFAKQLKIADSDFEVANTALTLALVSKIGKNVAVAVGVDAAILKADTELSSFMKGPITFRPGEFSMIENAEDRALCVKIFESIPYEQRTAAELLKQLVSAGQLKQAVLLFKSTARWSNISGISNPAISIVLLSPIVVYEKVKLGGEMQSAEAISESDALNARISSFKKHFILGIPTPSFPKNVDEWINEGRQLERDINQYATKIKKSSGLALDSNGDIKSRWYSLGADRELNAVIDVEASLLAKNFYAAALKTSQYMASEFDRACSR